MRYIVPIVLLVLIIGSLAGIKGSQIATLVQAGRTFAKEGPPPESVSTSVSRDMVWESSLSAVGSVVTAQGVAISSEVAGVVKRIRFESGQTVKAGQILVELDTRVEDAQLRTSKAQKRLAEQAFERTQALAQSGGVARAQLDEDTAGLESRSAELLALKAQIDRKQVRAPFKGRLGIREVNLGQYLNAGTKITTLESLDTIYVDFSLPQQALPQLQTGQVIRLTLESGQLSSGRIRAIDPSIDPATRTIQVRAVAENEQETLSPGMYVNVSVLLPGQTHVVAVPVTAILHAPYGDSLFVLEPMRREPKKEASVRRQVRQQFVRLGEQRGDFVSVLEGIKPQEEVVTSGAFKLRNGSGVVVNNAVKPEASLHPAPENR